jgi:hypothetical protein
MSIFLGISGLVLGIGGLFVGGVSIYCERKKNSTTHLSARQM